MHCEYSFSFIPSDLLALAKEVYPNQKWFIDGVYVREPHNGATDGTRFFPNVFSNQAWDVWEWLVRKSCNEDPLNNIMTNVGSLRERTILAAIKMIKNRDN